MTTLCDIDLSKVNNKVTITHEDGSELTIVEGLAVSEPSPEEKSELAKTAFSIGNLLSEKWQ